MRILLFTIALLVIHAASTQAPVDGPARTEIASFYTAHKKVELNPPANLGSYSLLQSGVTWCATLQTNGSQLSDDYYQYYKFYRCNADPMKAVQQAECAYVIRFNDKDLTSGKFGKIACAQ
jgi:hypothetical protein